MNPETEKNINEAIDWLQSTGGSIQDFAAEQAPLYCREVVAWTLWSGVASITLGVVLLIVGAWLMRKAVAMYHAKDNGDEVVPGMGGAIAIFAGIFITWCSASDTIKAIVAPRLVIVEHLRSLK